MPHAEILGHNLQFDLSFIKHHFDITCEKTWDTMLASQVLAGGIDIQKKGTHSLQTICQSNLQIFLPKELQKSDWSGPVTNEQISYAANDVSHLFPLRSRLMDKLAVTSLLDTAQLEFDLIPVIVNMFLNGISFDARGFEPKIERLQDECKSVKQAVERALGIVNANSNPQLLKSLRSMGYTVDGTSKEALVAHAHHPIIQQVLHYRRLSSFVSNTGKNLIAASKKYPDGRLRGGIKQIGTNTGRFSMGDPNIFGIPKRGDYCLRDLFISPPGNSMIVADYAASQLRILAHITRDPNLMATFRDGHCAHKATASILFKKSLNEISGEEREQAKPVNFGFCFGMGAKTFVAYAASYEVGITEDQARDFKESYLQSYSGIRDWQYDQGADGVTETRSIGGRVRYFPQSFYTEQLASPIQGTEADGFKRAMILCYRDLKNTNVKMVLSPHDELVFDAPNSEAVDAKNRIEAKMVEGMQHYVTEVPIVVEGHIQSSWDKLKKP